MTERLNSERVIARDDGFHPLVDEAEETLAPDTPLADLAQHLDRDLIAIEFPSFTDGRGFSLARRLRELGFKGRPVDREFRRIGIAARQPQDQWIARTDWKAFDHRAHLAG